MSAAAFERASEAFAAALSKPDAEREAYVRTTLAGEPEALTEALTLLRGTRAAWPFAVGRDRDPLFGTLPRTIQEYTLLERHAEGGMSVVYRARDERLSRPIALKILRPERLVRDGRTRFEHERDLWARLRHPGIAAVHDSGELECDGIRYPFLALEFVDGRQLADVIADERVTIEARVEMLIQVAAAVQHAHERGVLHRDLKPGNVLVESGNRARVLDFGIALAIDREMKTRTRELEERGPIGTLAYMSPEQIGGSARELTTRSDVYALGVLGFEMLACALPHDLDGLTVTETLERLRTLEPRPLEIGSHRWRAELQTILYKAMDPDRTRRYATAEAFAADLLHVVRDEPILARRPSTTYQLRKFARRHRGLVAAAASVLVVLVAGIAVSAWFARDARAERDRTLETLTFLENMIENAAWELGGEARIVELLERSRSQIGPHFAADPLTEGRLQHSFGKGLLNSGSLAAAKEQLERAVAVREQTVGPSHRTTIESRIALAVTHRDLGWEFIAEQQFKDVLAIPGLDPDLMAEAQREFARLLLGKGVTAGLASLVDAEASMHMVPGGVPVRAALALHSRAGRGELEQSAENMRASVELSSTELSPDHPQTWIARSTLSNFLSELGEHEEAIPMASEALERLSVKLGERHMETISARSNLGAALDRAGRADEAIVHMQRAFDDARSSLGAAHRLTRLCQFNLGNIFLMLDREEESLTCLLELIELEESALGPRSTFAVEAKSTVGHVLAVSAKDRGKLMWAEALLLEALENETVLDDLTVAEAHLALGIARVNLGALALASSSFELAFRAVRCSEVITRDGWIHGMSFQVKILVDQGRLEEARTQAFELLDLVSAMDEIPDVPALAVGMSNARKIASRDMDAARYASCAQLLEALIPFESRIYPASEPAHAISRDMLGICLLRTNRAAEAEPVLREAWDALESQAKRSPFASHTIPVHRAQCALTLGKLDEGLRFMEQALTAWERDHVGDLKGMIAATEAVTAGLRRTERPSEAEVWERRLTEFRAVLERNATQKK